MEHNHIRQNRLGNYVASITIYPGKPETPKRSVNVSGGTYKTREEAKRAVNDIYTQLKTLKTYEEKRQVVDEYRNKHSTSARKKKCCGSNWVQCPICGKLFSVKDA